MRLAYFSSLAAAVLVSACSSVADPVGSYIHVGSDIVAMLQITEVRDGQVEATLSAVVIDPAGKISAGVRPVTGTLIEGAINLRGDQSTGRAPITGLLSGNSADLTFFNDGISHSLQFQRESPRSFNEHATKLRSLAAARVRASAEVSAGSDRVANRRELQAKIDLVANSLAVQAAKISDGVARLSATIDEHTAVATEIGRLSTAANTIRSRGEDPNGKILQIEGQISYLLEGRRQPHARAEDFVQRATEAGKVADAMSDYEQLCVEDPRLDCSKLTSSLNKLSRSIDSLDAIAASERSAFAKLETEHAV